MAMIPWWIHYPYVNNEIINQDWILQISNENTDKIENFIGVNTIKYADPILWDITSQYEANTIVVDPQTGDAYISTKAVPYGVALSNVSYWTRIYNYASELHVLREQIAADEQLSTTATAPRSVDDLVFLNGLLYIVTAPMIAGDSYVEGSNCAKTTINAQLLRLHTSIGAEAQARADADTALGRRIDDEVQAREDADTALGGRIDDEVQAREDADTALGGRIDDEVQAREDADTALGGRIDNLDINHVYNQSTPESGLSSNIGLKEGTYDITEDLTINAQLVVPKGAVLNIASGVTLTINGQILAGRYQIFSGDGSVVVNAAHQPVGYPEWFGAIADGVTDSTEAIQTCLDVFSITELTNATYLTSDTLQMSRPNTILRGSMGYRGTNSRISINSGALTTLIIGNIAKPSAINDLVTGITVDGVELTRNVDWVSGAIGLHLKWCLHTTVKNCSITESSIGIYLQVSVFGQFNNNKIYSTTLPSRDTTRSYDGIRIDASDTIQGIANASNYFNQCLVTTGGGIYEQSYGIRGFGTGTMSDINITQCEINSVDYGITFVGTNDRTKNQDIIITNNVIDSIGCKCIDIQSMAWGNVTISNNYCAVGQLPSSLSGQTQSCINIYQCTLINITNNQLLGIVASDTCYGIIIGNSLFITCDGNNIYECDLSHFISGSLNCKLADTVYNDQTTSTYVINVASGSLIEINCNIKAKASYAVNLSNGVTNCEVNATLINRGDISGNIILIDGAAPTANGYFNSNYITGYFVEPTP